MFSPCRVYFGLLALVACSEAAHLQLSGRLHGSTSPGLGRRTSIAGTMASLADSENLAYLANVTLNGAAFSVMIDTGSSDLWVAPPVPNVVSQNYHANVAYAVGSASGEVMSATLDFAGFSIPSQFFIQAPQGNAAGGADGLIGLGPSSGSIVRLLGRTATANPPLDRIFTSNTSLSPLIAILLQRSDDPEDPYPGDLAIGEVLSNHQDILNQPQHPVTLVHALGGQHWQTLLDVNGIIGPNGQPIQIKTQVTGAQTENATVIFDTGFTLPQVPSYVAQALYGEISGAVLTNITGTGELWVLPCDQPVNATFFFGGVEFPIHPLDLNFDGLDLRTDDGKNYCIGAFQPISYDTAAGGNISYDMVLGMAFLRNSYMLINFGNLVNAATPSTDTAYIQLLPITNATEAIQDFARVRNGTNGATADEIRRIFGSHDSSGSRSGVAAWLIGVIIVGIGILTILLVVCVTCCCCRRRRTKNMPPPGTAWITNRLNYRPINEPSPHAAYDMYLPPGASRGYASAHSPEYVSAWDARR